MLVEEAFQQHDHVSPEVTEKSALCYSQPSKSSYSNANPETWKRPTASVARNGRPKISQSAIRELSQLLPNREIIYLLVDNYFVKIHWYMLLFHQHKFRHALNSLYSDAGSTAPATGRQDESTAGYISVLLAVCALSLRYTSTAQREQLSKHAVNVESLRESILNVLRLRLLDILALGSLEAVQLCVLLGSYYLYHGEPELAWPLCGCALRLAQALELHRRPVPGMVSQHETEVRKRCWWAVHEIETYCSMVYGFPLSMSDSDCNTEPLDPSDQWSIAADGQPSSSRQPTLLVYKCSMSALSKIIKSALEDLYRSRQKQHRFEINNAQNEKPRRLQFIADKIKTLNTELVEWYDDLPSKLKMGRLSGLPASEARGDLANHTPSHVSLDEKLFKLQALALKLAFENARILIHRPLLLRKDGQKTEFPSSTTNSTVLSLSESLSAYSRTCHDAALQISWAGHRRIFRDASATYALNFIALHLLTAGVTLGIMTSLNPLSQESFEAKLGIRRIMEMQVSLKPDSIVADQGLQILRKLFLLVMNKETHSMLDFSTQGYREDEHEGVQECQDGGNLPTGLGKSTGNNDQAIESGVQSSHLHTADQTSEMITGFQRDTSTQSIPYEFCQPAPQSPISEAMLAVEQDEDLFPSNSGNDGPAMIGQDHGWLWDPELDIGLLE
uniref:Xylanolytic transcriptional activator regulatory domain-containing protein n=1 Tax=Bionectria ochroleuca TaxID=29856 RepID=A0A0B7JJS4_BIOOC